MAAKLISNPWVTACAPVSAPQSLDTLSVPAMTSDELLSSGHFQMPFDIVRDGEEESTYIHVGKDNVRIWYAQEWIP